jgi:hypothetical protein
MGASGSWSGPCMGCGKSLRPQGTRAIDGYPGTLVHVARHRCNACYKRYRKENPHIVNAPGKAGKEGVTVRPGDVVPLDEDLEWVNPMDADQKRALVSVSMHARGREELLRFAAMLGLSTPGGHAPFVAETYLPLRK